MTEHDNPFLDTGYTDPEDAIRIRHDTSKERHSPHLPRQRRRLSGIGPQRGEEEGVGYENGVPYYLQHRTELSEQQQVINARGEEAVAPVLEKIHQDNARLAARGNAALEAALLRARQERRD